MACIFYEMPYAFFEGAKRGVFAGLMMPFLPFGNFFQGLFYYLVIFLGVGARCVVEMPPFGAQCVKPGFRHYSSQQSAIVHGFARELPGPYEFLFFVNVGCCRHVVNLCAHRYAVSVFIGNSYVNCHAVVVQPAAVCGVVPATVFHIVC